MQIYFHSLIWPYLPRVPIIFAMTVYLFLLLLFSHLADAFIQKDLQIRKSN